MTLAFVDTGAWVALSDNTDADHRKALAFYRGLPRGTRLVTTNYVVAETYTWLRYRSSHRHALGFHTLLAAAVKRQVTRIEWITPDVHEAGWLIFARYEDQILSMTDCTSAVVAREQRADYIFAFDSDFSILGFDVRPGP